jgi:serine/threonine protein kinase
MGEVYLAEHEVLGRKVAIKVLAPHLAGDPEAVRRFHKSMQLLARLNPHPNVAAALHASDYQGRLYLVLEYVPGTDLRAHVRQCGPLAPNRAADYIRQAAVGLDHAHQHGIVHRDVKPSNLMLTPEGTVKVLDLGLARLTATSSADEDITPTAVDALIGTLDYVAPEQARDARQADARSDLYSLGATFYYLLTGRAPFEGRSPVEKLMAHAHQLPEPLEQLRPDVLPALAAVVHRLLAKNPEDRYPSARAFLTALDAAMGKTPTSAETPGSGSGPLSRSSRRYLLLAAIGALVPAVWLAFLNRPSRDGARLSQPEADPTSPKLTEPFPEPYSLSRLEIWLGSAQPPSHLVYRELIRDGKDEHLGPLPALRSTDGLKVQGQLNRAGHWYVVWIDTNGKVTVAASSRGEQTEVEYPRRKDPHSDALARASPKDPKGFHLLLLAAGDVPPEKGTPLLQKQLARVGKPPAFTWAGKLRGPEEVELPGELPPAYLARINNLMPQGLRPVYALFFQTVP